MPPRNLNHQLQTLLLRRAVMQTRYENEVLRTLKPYWRDAQASMLAAVRGAGISGKEAGPAALLQGLTTRVDQQQRVHALMVQLIGIWRYAVDRAVQTLHTSLVDFAELELIEVPQAIQALLDTARLPDPLREAEEDEPLSGVLSATFTQVPAAQIAQLLTTPLGGAFFAQSFGDLSAQVLAQLRNALNLGLLQGQGVPAVTRAVMAVMGSSRWKAERIVRSEFGRVAAQAAQLQFKQNERLLRGVRWLATLDQRTCVLQGMAQVLTSTGWKQIRKVRIGEYVLTHNDTFERVEATHRRDYVGEVVEIRFINARAPGQGRVTLTADHEVLVCRGDQQQQWLPARELIAGDLVLAPGHKCSGKSCNKIVPEWRTLCSHCVVVRRNEVSWTEEARRRASVEWKGKMSSEHREAGRLRFKTLWADPQYRKQRTVLSRRTLRRQWKNPEWKARQEVRLKAQGFKPGWQLKDPERAEAIWKASRSAVAKNKHGGTFAEKKLAWLLGLLKIQYNSQHYMPAEGTRHWVDFYLPDFNTVIEVDGVRFHQDKAKDLAREDRIRRAYGCTFVRFTDVEIKKSLGAMVRPQLERLVAGCVVPVKIKRVTKKMLRPRTKNGCGQTVYDLTVAKHHSFFVNGMAVHNCVQCGALDGREWADPAAAPVPVVSTHPQCRCVLIPVIKWLPGVEFPTSTRASMAGQVSAKLTYKDWFGQQDAEFQRGVLGPTRYRLWKNGALKLGDFSTATGVRSVKSALALARSRV